MAKRHQALSDTRLQQRRAIAASAQTEPSERVLAGRVALGRGDGEHFRRDTRERSVMLM